MSELRTIPNVGACTEQDLIQMGYPTIASLRGKSAEELYAGECRLRGCTLDRCQLYLYRAVEYFVNTEHPDPMKCKWWFWKDDFVEPSPCGAVCVECASFPLECGGCRKIKGKVDFALSAGGDNYCYENQAFYAFLNKEYQKKGIKTVLWGCSIEPEVIKKKKVLEDLKSYNLIVARESITYQSLKEIGANVILNPDPAFYMKSEKCILDKRFENGDVIGVNISPMIISNEKCNGSAYENYRKMIEYILNHTSMYIALIPHVVWKQNDDRTILQKIYKEFNYNERIILVNDHTAPQLKYIISKCRIFVGARTHSTIAAYSTEVPTLVVGYSVKARGIAKDIFGTDQNYVLPVQELRNGEELTNAFQWIQEREIHIRKHLKETIPNYVEQGRKIKTILEKI